MSFDRGLEAYPGIEVRPVRLRKAVEGRPHAMVAWRN
jgi:hypothetical protein